MMNRPISKGAPAHIRRFCKAVSASPPLLWSFVYFFCLLSGYYVLRPVREAMAAAADIETVFPPVLIAWFQTHGIALKDFVLQFLFTCTFFIMLALQPAYGWLVSRWPRRVFLPAVYGFFILTLVGFYVLYQQNVPGRGMAFFWWLTVFNLFAVAVFWSFMADVFTDTEARACYGYIGAAGTLGAFLGPILTQTLVQRVGIGNLMLVSGGFLLVCLVCIWRLRHWALVREARQQRSVPESGSGETPMGGGVLDGLRLVLREPLLRWMALGTLFGVGIGGLLYNEQAAIVRVAYPDPAMSTLFYSRLDLAINALTLVVQLGMTRWLLSRFGLAPALLIPAGLVLIGFSVLAASPLPLMVAVTQVASRAGEFSLGKPARETIYTRVGRQWRYKAGAAIDTAVYRGGDITFVWVYKGLSVLGSKMVFVAGIVVTAAFVLTNLGILREQKKLPRED